MGRGCRLSRRACPLVLADFAASTMMPRLYPMRATAGQQALKGSEARRG